MTTTEYFAYWLRDIARPSVRQSTLRDDHHYVNAVIAPAIGAVPLRRLSAIQIQSLLANLEKENMSPALRRKVYGVISSALRKAVRLGLIATNPCAAVTPPRVPLTKMRFLTVEQITTLIALARDDRHQALFVLATTVGCRLGELFGLMWSDIDFKSGTLSISRSVTEARENALDYHSPAKPMIVDPKTPSSRRQIRLPDMAVAALRDHRRKMLAEGHLVYVFCDENGGLLRRSNFIRRHWKPLVTALTIRLKADGVPEARLRFHDLRHSAAALRFSLGDNLMVAKVLLGHASIRTTGDIYGHLAHSVQDDSARRVDDALRRARRKRRRKPLSLR